MSKKKKVDYFRKVTIIKNIQMAGAKKAESILVPAEACTPDSLINNEIPDKLHVKIQTQNHKEFTFKPQDFFLMNEF